MKESKDNRVTIQTRCNIKTLATLAVWLESNGARLKSRSELLYIITETLQDILIKNGKVEKGIDIESAYASLTKLGLHWPRGTRGHKEITVGLEIESITTEFDKAPEDQQERIKKIMEDMKNESTE